MANSLQSVKILGLHGVQPTPEEFENTLAIQWGDDLTGEALERARASVRDHYSGLYLIEVQIEPSDADVNWGDFTQQLDNEPRSNWQVAYEERPVNQVAGIWAFFVHFLDRTKPLETPMGPSNLPSPTPIPSHLAGCKYCLP